MKQKEGSPKGEPSYSTYTDHTHTVSYYLPGNTDIDYGGLKA